MTALNMSMMVVGLVITTLCLFTAKGEEEKVSITRYITLSKCSALLFSSLARY